MFNCSAELSLFLISFNKARVRDLGFGKKTILKSGAFLKVRQH